MKEYLETLEHKKSGGEYQLIGSCPFCGAYKPKDTRVYFNPKKNVGICHHCSKVFSLVNYVSALYGINQPEANKIIKNEESGYIRTEIQLEEPNIYVPQNLVDISSSIEASDYCVMRGITQELISKFGLKYIPENEEMKGKTYYVGKRIFIPIYDKDNILQFWQARDITGKAKNKYLFPRGIDKSKYIYNEPSLQENNKYVILCEGIMDVFGWTKANKLAVALFGKYMSNSQFDLLLKNNIETIYVALDQDAIKYSIDIQKRLSQATKVKFIKMERDSDECSRYELERMFSSAVEYSWGDSILTLLQSGGVGQFA